MSKMWCVVNQYGKVFAGVSTITFEAMWFDCGKDMSHAGDVGAFRFKRDKRWLDKALRYDSTAQWKEYTLVNALMRS